MNINDLDLVLEKQKEYFNSGVTLDVNFRIEMLKKLYKAIKDNEPILLNVVIDSEEALPMLPPGAGINEMIGEYKLERDVI